MSALEGTQPVQRQSPPRAFLLDDRGVQAEVGRARGRDQSARAASDRDEIVLCRHLR